MILQVQMLLCQVIKLIGFNTKTCRWGKANCYLTGHHNKLRLFDLYISSNQCKTKQIQQPTKSFIFRLTSNTKLYCKHCKKIFEKVVKSNGWLYHSYLVNTKCSYYRKS